MLEVTIQVAKLLWEPIKFALEKRNKYKNEREEFLRISFDTNKHISQVLITAEDIVDRLESMDNICNHLRSFTLDYVLEAQAGSYSYDDDFPKKKKRNKKMGEKVKIEQELQSFYNYHKSLLKVLIVQRMNIRILSEFIHSEYHYLSALFPKQANQLFVIGNAKQSLITELLRRLDPREVSNSRWGE